MSRSLVAVVALAALSMAGTPASSAPVHAERPDLIKADKVLVVKGERRLYLLRGDSVLRVYRVSLGRNPQGHKVFEGDGRTPEGSYVLDRRNEDSRFYRSIHISYPNLADVQWAARWGLPAGGNIMIHGESNRRRAAPDGTAQDDWTEGCIAVMNKEMDEIWRTVDDGTPIEISP